VFFHKLLFHNKPANKAKSLIETNGLRHGKQWHIISLEAVELYSNRAAIQESFMKLKLLFLFVFLIASLTISIPAQKKDLIGYKHKGVVYGATLPNGAKDLGGGLLSNENYGVTRFSKGKKFMLWLEKITARDVNGFPNWEVKDVLVFDALKKNQEFLLSYGSSCVQNKKENLDLIVMAEFLPKTKTYKVLRAWRANVKKERFEKVSNKGIVCKYVEP
jgi:hypothetical protein